MNKECTANKKELIIRLIISLIGIGLVGIFVWTHGFFMHIATFEIVIIALVFFGTTIIFTVRKFLKSDGL